MILFRENTLLRLLQNAWVKMINFDISFQELNILCWILASITGYLVIYGLNLPEIFAGNIPPKAALDIYGGFHRLAWGVAVSWVIFACCRGYGGNSRSQS